MTGSIEWQKVTPKMRVKTVGHHYEAAGKLVTWGSRDARAAQMYLMHREKADAQPSYFISGNINMTEEGQSIPILYGRFLSGTMLLNASLEVVDLL